MRFVLYDTMFAVSRQLLHENMTLNQLDGGIDTIGCGTRQMRCFDRLCSCESTPTITFDTCMAERRTHRASTVNS
jgi:hypothetical protein